MTKRKLTKRQHTRVADHQRQSRLKAGAVLLDDVYLEPSDLGLEETGLLISNYGRKALLESSDHQYFECHFRQNLDNLVTGDQVVWRRDQNQSGVITAILPRKSLLSRPDRSGHAKPLAANVTQIVIVLAPEPVPTHDLINRYLAACELQKLKPLLVFNKIDLLKDAEQITPLLQIYEQIGYDVLKTSPIKSLGLTQLEAQLSNHTSIFVGQSGVGKSSLIFAMLPHEHIRIGDLSTKTSLGKHTTSVTKLYHFLTGGDLIDSPGVRHFNLGQVSPEQLLQGFIEFKPFIGRCKFRDCTHQHEPDCALLYAIEEGHIAQARLESYLNISRSL